MTKEYNGVVKKHSSKSGIGRAYFPKDWVDHEFKATKGKKIIKKEEEGKK